MKAPSGTTYASATGDAIRPIGSDCLYTWSEDGGHLKHNYELADKEISPAAAITSLGSVTSKGSRVVLDDDPDEGNCLQGKKSGRKIYFDKRRNVHSKEVWVRKPTPNQHADDGDHMWLAPEHGNR